MEKNTLDRLCKQVYRQYPMVKGKTPYITKQGSDRYLLVYTAQSETPDGKSIQQKVRIVADESGMILKSTMSK